MPMMPRPMTNPPVVNELPGSYPQAPMAPAMPAGPMVKPAAGRTAGDLPVVSLPGNNLMPYQSPIEVLQGDAIMSMQTPDQMAPMMAPSMPPMGASMSPMMPPPMSSPMGAPMMSGDAMSAMAGGLPNIELPTPQQPLTSMSPRSIAGMGDPMMSGVGAMPPMMARRNYMGM